jgi:hypothetical protein
LGRRDRKRLYGRPRGSARTGMLRCRSVEVGAPDAQRNLFSSSDRAADAEGLERPTSLPLAGARRVVESHVVRET